MFVKYDFSNLFETCKRWPGITENWNDLKSYEVEKEFIEPALGNTKMIEETGEKIEVFINTLQKEIDDIMYSGKYDFW